MTRPSPAGSTPRPGAATRATQVATVVAIFTAAVLIAQLVAANATRDALFLSHFDASDLPAAIVAAAILSLVYLPLLTRLLRRFGPAVVTGWTGVASALLLMGEWFVGLHAPRIAAVAFFIHVGIFGASLVSGFWSVTNERFDPYTAKHLMGRIAGGATAGGSRFSQTRVATRPPKMSPAIPQ